MTPDLGLPLVWEDLNEGRCRQGWDNKLIGCLVKLSRVFRGFIGIMGKKMEITIIYYNIIGIYRDYNEIYWGYIRIIEKKMETTI